MIARQLLHGLKASWGIVVLCLSLLQGEWQLARGAVFHVPQQFSTIQAAIDHCVSGDSVLVSPGTYSESLLSNGKRIHLASTGGSTVTTIDPAGVGRAVTFDGGGVIRGFTLRRGYAQDVGGGILLVGTESAIIAENVIEACTVGSFDVGEGGGIYLSASTSGILVDGNVIRDNAAGASGGGLYDRGVENVIVRNKIVNNYCHVSGGGLWIAQSYVRNNLILRNVSDSFGAGISGGGIEISSNTVVANRTNNNFRNGAGIHINGGGPLVERNIVVGNTGSPGANAGVGILCNRPFLAVRFQCNDSWGNDGGDYLFNGNCDSLGAHNISADPQFCAADRDDYTLFASSPCAPNSACGLIGAFGIACAETQVVSSSWSRIKSMMRQPSRTLP